MAPRTKKSLPEVVSGQKAYIPTEILRQGLVYQKGFVTKPEGVPPTRPVVEYTIYRDADTPPQTDPFVARVVEFRMVNRLDGVVIESGRADSVGKAVQYVEDWARSRNLLLEIETE